MRAAWAARMSAMVPPEWYQCQASSVTPMFGPDASHRRSVSGSVQTNGTGGGGGGAVYQDGNKFDLSLCGSSLHDNAASQGGGALFYVSNDLTGTMSIVDSVLKANPSGQFETAGLPGVFVLAAPGQPVVTRSTLSP